MASRSSLGSERSEQRHALLDTRFTAVIDRDPDVGAGLALKLVRALQAEDAYTWDSGSAERRRGILDAATALGVGHTVQVLYAQPLAKTSPRHIPPNGGNSDSLQETMAHSAVILAAVDRAPVAFTFQDVSVVVNRGDPPDAIEGRWKRALEAHIDRQRLDS